MEIVELTTNNIEEQLDACVGLQKHLVSEGTVINPRQFIATVRSDHNYVIGLFEDNALIGIGMISKIVHPVHTNAYVNNIVIDPAFRRKGYFSLLMQALEAKARDWGCDRVELTCSREAVQPLYIKRGYTEKNTKFFILSL